MHGGQTARRLEHPQSTPERGLTIEALAHQAHVTAAWLGEEFKNGQAPPYCVRDAKTADVEVSVTGGMNRPPCQKDLTRAAAAQSSRP
jgi:hypothetical protein